jgi:hypothetical protein
VQTGDAVIETATTDELAEALSGVVASGGLPSSEATAGLLLDLKSVYARAVVPGDRLSRLHALNELLPRLIASLSDSRYREATQLLFGLAPGSRGTTLTARRRQAAARLGYNADHFRTNIEATVVNAVAVAVHDDLLRYQSRVKRAAESLEPTGDTPRLGPEHITAEEELVSRIWQHVYGLRAETIAILRLSEKPGMEAQAEDHRQAALRAESQLRQLLREYVETYGKQLIAHGDAEFSVEALGRLAGWEG